MEFKYLKGKKTASLRNLKIFDSYLSEPYHSISRLLKWHQSKEYALQCKAFTKMKEILEPWFKANSEWTQHGMEFSINRFCEFRLAALPYVDGSMAFPPECCETALVSILRECTEKYESFCKDLRKRKDQWIEVILQYLSGELPHANSRDEVPVTQAEHPMLSIFRPKPHTQETDRRIDYIQKEVSPVLNKGNNARIGYRCEISIDAIDNLELHVKIYTFNNREFNGFSTKTKAFQIADPDFEPKFQVWWKLSLLELLKWMKA